MTIQELFVRSNEELGKVVDAIGDDQWQMKLPEGSSSSPDTTLLAAVAYHAYDDAWVPDVLAGKTIDEVGAAYTYLLSIDAEQIRSAYREQNIRACATVHGYGELMKTVHLSYGDFLAGEYLQHITTFRAFRTYDIAKLIGIDTTLPEDYVQALWDEFSPLIEDYRQMGVFPPALPVSEDANLQTKLLALVGRE